MMQGLLLKAGSCSSGQRMPWKLKAPYHVHRNPLLDLILSQLQPIHTLMTYLF